VATLRVVTFNIKHGLTPQGVIDLGLLASTCAAFEADLLALQEVDRRARRSGWRDEMSLVARATGLQGRAFGEAARRGLMRRYGNALLARGGVSQVEVIGLPKRVGTEHRVAILASAEANGCELSVAATHLSFRRAEGPEQLEAVLEALGRRPLPRLLMGDLNLVPAVVEPMVAAAGYKLAPTAETFPADAPRTRIDYVAVAGGEVTATESPWTPVSDHRPVVAEVEL
jgi:endonuclease/exonuclease/phosphatase family metal-dependent hydrolase